VHSPIIKRTSLAGTMESIKRPPWPKHRHSQRISRPRSRSACFSTWSMGASNQRIGAWRPRALH